MTPYSPLVPLWMAAILLLSGHFWLRALCGNGEGGLSWRSDAIAWASWSLASGAVLTSILLFAWLWALPGTMTSLGFATLQLAVLASLWLWTRRADSDGEPVLSRPRTPFQRASTFERSTFWLALGVALSITVVRILDTNLSAALTGDSALLWTFKARVIHETGGLGGAYVEAMGDPRLRHENYPLFNPLLQMWMFQLRDASVFVAQRFPIQLLNIALVLGLAAALRRSARPVIAAVLLTIFAVSPVTRHALSFAGADAMVSFGLLVATDAWLRWRADRNTSYLRVMAIGLTLMIGSKTEASIFLLTFAGGLFLLYLVERFGLARKSASNRRGLLAFSLPLAVFLAGTAFNLFAGFENDLATGKGTGIGFTSRLIDQWQEYLGTVGSYFFESALLSPRFDGLIFACLFIATLLSIKNLMRGPRATRDLIVPITLCAGLWAGLFLIYLATPQPLVWHLESSALRVLWQAIPVAAVALAGLLESAQYLGGEPRP